MNAHTPLPYDYLKLGPEALEAITGVKIPERDEVRFYPVGAKASKGPALKLRRSRRPGERGTWNIVDRLTRDERIALGQRNSRVRVSTGCPGHDRDGAAAKLIEYLRDKQSRILAHKRPADIPLSALLIAYERHAASGAHKLKPGTVDTYSQKLVPLGEFFGATPLGALTPNMERKYEEWRTKQTVAGRGKKPISATQVGHEIAQLRIVINHFRRQTQINLPIVHYMPERDTPPVVWWRRHEIARYLWCCRGRISVPVLDEHGQVVGHRWKVARDLDPTLVGPEGDKRVLRPKEEIAARYAETRLVRLGLHAPSRGKVLISAVYAESAAGAYVSLSEGALRRKPIGPDTSNKRRPPAPLGAKLTHLVVCWGRMAVKPNAYRTRRAMHIIHRPDGTPHCPSSLATIRKRILADCGVAKPMGATVLRHTSAMWMKIEKVSLWIAADRLGITARVCEERYGTWDNLGIYEATIALCRGFYQKQAYRLAASEGVLHML